MKPLSAVDAITPAFTRTHQLLFEKPLRYGRIWKLCASSYLAYCGSIFIPFPLFFLFIPHDAFHGIPRLFFYAMLVPFIIYLALLYFAVRMEFVEFEMIVTSARKIAPMWNRYGARTWPWLLTKVVLGILICTAFAPLVAHQVRSFATLFAHATPSTPPDFEHINAAYSGVMGFYGIFFLVILCIKTASTILGDFVLPFYAIENISLGEACLKGLAVLKKEPLHMAGYLGLKFILAILGYVLLEFAVIACMIPLMIIFFVVVLLGAFLGHLITGAAGHLVLLAGGILLAILGYGLLFAIIFAMTGYLMNLLSSYAIYFLGGRYPLLGDYLEPPPPSTPFTPPPIFPSPEEQKDDDGTPPFPMDPALA